MVRTSGDEGGFAEVSTFDRCDFAGVASVKVGEMGFVDVSTCDSGAGAGAIAGGDGSSLTPLDTGYSLELGSSLGLDSNKEGRDRKGSDLVGRSGICSTSPVFGDIWPKSVIGGRLGIGLSAPGDVRYVISCRHLDRQRLFITGSMKKGKEGRETYCLRYSLLLALLFGSRGIEPMFFHGLVSEPFVDPDDDFDVPAWCPFVLSRSRRGHQRTTRVHFHN